MPNYSELSNEQLVEHFTKLQEEYTQACEMDGSGELGGVIWKGFEPHIDAIEYEINKRGIDLYGHNEEFIPTEEDKLPF
jgi:hypothetical protein